MEKRTFTSILAVFFLAFCSVGIPNIAAAAEKPIVIGAPLATAFLYGWDAERGIKLAVEEINAAGGVNVGGKRDPSRPRSSTRGTWRPVYRSVKRSLALKS